MIEIVRADYGALAHGEAIVNLMSEYACDPMGGGQDLSVAVKANLVAALAQRPIAHTILAFVDGEAAGLVNCLEGFSTFACKPLLNIHDVIVSKAHRGQGLSKRMLAEAEAIARELGCCKLTLEVLEGNRVAQKAYRACGFSGYELDPAMGQAMFWDKRLDA
ncbi:GNAT family N-acetyltransferase [filamentous cyanobacterium LEGE 11480]|uniref:GNAT family N-acetyltransferase n=1 Tax=Romeriopsis navalis LEGE 11480 TaxID=2777977 RepID=A0A928VVG7_9CYAN|nr:GNAT family N-acetyltransferase [Romeriopsis navalis]MBE9033325.1 GNAT family N-acetyltransferase [Romeriopsis navalis LEGE 11480]